MNFTKQISRMIRIILAIATCLTPIKNGLAQVQLTESNCTEISEGKILLDIRFELDSTYYIQSHTPSDDSFIPTTFTVRDHQGMEIEQINFIGEKLRSESNQDLGRSIFSKSFSIQIVAVDKAGPNTIFADLHFQASDGIKSLLPDSHPVELSWPKQDLLVKMARPTSVPQSGQMPHPTPFEFRH